MPAEVVGALIAIGGMFVGSVVTALVTLKVEDKRQKAESARAETAKARASLAQVSSAAESVAFLCLTDFVFHPESKQPADAESDGPLEVMSFVSAAGSDSFDDQGLCAIERNNPHRE